MQENKLKNICDFYSITHRLKNLIRTGSIAWNVKAERLDSVAEHIYGTQMLAFAVNSEFELGLNIEKIVFMLAFHELGETIVGDIPPVDVQGETITKEEKHKLEENAVLKILEPMGAGGDKIRDIFFEYEEGKTKEAKFARMVDKLECDFQIKFFEENGCNDFTTPRVGTFEKLRQEYIAKGYTTMAKAWIEYDKKHYDGLFKSIADYLSSNDVFKK